MPAPSPLAIATSSVRRLVKEEAYYHKELADQQVRVDQLESQIKDKSANLDENADYTLKQEKQAIEQTKSIFEPLRTNIKDAVAKLEEQIAFSESEEGTSADELTQAKEMLQQGQKALKADA